MSGYVCTFSKISKDYGGNFIFRDIDLEILENERIGRVGENGGGKSTLFKLLAGKDTPTEGVISRRRNLTIGYLAQEADPGQSHKTVFEAVSEVTQELVDLPLMLSQLEARMADPEVASDPDLMIAILDEYGKAQERFDALGGYTQSTMNEPQAISFLRGLLFSYEDIHIPIRRLSGGEIRLLPKLWRLAMMVV
jgi:ATP-binding cassette subfamily F protein 3